MDPPIDNQTPKFFTLYIPTIPCQLSIAARRPNPYFPTLRRGDGVDDSIRDSERLTKERHDRQQGATRRGRVSRKKLYLQTPQGVAVTADGGLLQLLIDFSNRCLRSSGRPTSLTSAWAA